MCRPVVQCLSLLFLFRVHAGKLGQVTNFRPTIVCGTGKYCIDQYMALFHCCLLGGNTVILGGLHARLCHVFLVIFCDSVIRSTYVAFNIYVL